MSGPIGDPDPKGPPAKPDLPTKTETHFRWGERP